MSSDFQCHSPLLSEVVGKDWIDRQRRIVQQHAAAYQRTSWNKIFGLLTSAGLNADGKEGSVSRSALKERFRVFNATFEELHRSQCMWKIPDPELRSAVQLQIAEVLLPAYRAFVQRYTAVESLGEEVGEVVGGGNFANGDVTNLDKVANEVVAKLDVFGATMKDGFLGEVNGTVVVTPQGGAGLWGAKVGEQIAEPTCLLSCHRDRV
ncbi:unnamed protein product [Closterium sp. NIES-54]